MGPDAWNCRPSFFRFLLERWLGLNPLAMCGVGGEDEHCILGGSRGSNGDIHIK